MEKIIHRARKQGIRKEILFRFSVFSAFGLPAQQGSAPHDKAQFDSSSETPSAAGGFSVQRER